MTNHSDIESALVLGDLSRLNATERINYYLKTCASLGLNPLTKPFEYITLNGKLTLYARKDATDQLRKINKISIGKPDITFSDDFIIVTIAARNAEGREDSDVGVVNKKDMRGDFGNALMKAVTKAKRRVTLSICGLGMLDETEVETISEAKLGPMSQLPAPTLTVADVKAEHGNGDATTTTITAPPAIAETDTGAPTLAQAYADFQTAWGDANKLGIRGPQYFASTKDTITTIVDKTTALRDAIAERKASSIAGK